MKILELHDDDDEEDDDDGDGDGDEDGVLLQLKYSQANSAKWTGV